jgi:hypothetical protein
MPAQPLYKQRVFVSALPALSSGTGHAGTLPPAPLAAVCGMVSQLPNSVLMEHLSQVGLLGCTVSASVCVCVCVCVCACVCVCVVRACLCKSV